jgi:hypothetical protein
VNITYHVLLYGEWIPLRTCPILVKIKLALLVKRYVTMHAKGGNVAGEMTIASQIIMVREHGTIEHDILYIKCLFNIVFFSFSDKCVEAVDHCKKSVEQN